uniref:Uncharacterized protein n=1 Tax=Rhizophora mucronata TaxID=61149 RepID=A0A2P2MEH4_RHIMU
MNINLNVLEHKFLEKNLPLRFNCHLPQK